MKSVLGMLKSKNKFERAEGYAIIAMLGGAIILSLGIGLTIVSTKGISAVLAMSGALISFLATVALIGVWLVKEFSD
ncbi:MAG: hypothetical protein ACK4MM_03145 [Fervidobacterium sp.]